MAAGPAIKKLAKTELQSDQISTKEVFEGYIKGACEFLPIIEEVTDNLAQGLYAISCLLDPHKMVFGGSVIVNNPFLLKLIKEKLRSYLLPEQRHILSQMSISTLKQDNGVVGAGLRVFERL